MSPLPPPLSGTTALVIGAAVDPDRTRAAGPRPPHQPGRPAAHHGEDAPALVRAAVYLASPAAICVTGAVLPWDGDPLAAGP